ncbi:hypothetical protein L4D76_27095 [Photobacterium sagamiensis]|uniref:hypothetical protein n=1 Tax=Photobacterium sagamiensis TaxID=2910241 RepID=UPI003D151B99
MVLEKFDAWIDEINKSYKYQAISCESFYDHFKGYYSRDFLRECRYVITNDIPKPSFPELIDIGLGDFLDMDCGAITYKNTYFMKPQHKDDLEIHIHELVHSIQWQKLGGIGFLQRYAKEINVFGYDDAPLENMAYEVGRHFINKGKPFSILKLVESKI